MDFSAPSSLADARRLWTEVVNDLEDLGPLLSQPVAFEDMRRAVEAYLRNA